MPWTAEDVDNYLSSPKKWTAESVDSYISDIRSGKVKVSFGGDFAATSKPVSPAPTKLPTMNPAELAKISSTPTQSAQPVRNIQGLQNKLESDKQLIDMGIMKVPEPTLGQKLTAGFNNTVDFIGRRLSDIDVGAKNVVSGLANVARIADKWITSKIAPNYAKEKGGFLFGNTLDPYISDLEERRDISAMHAREGASNIENILGQAVQSMPQMTVGMPMFVASAMGQYARDAEQKGANLDQQALYGLIGGGIEGTLEKALGVVPGLGNLDDIAKGGLRGVLKNAAGEAVEEAITDPLTGLAEKVIFNRDLPWYSTTDDAVVNPVTMGQSALGGAALGGLVGGAGMIGRGQNTLNTITNETVKPSTDPNIPDLGQPTTIPQQAPTQQTQQQTSRTLAQQESEPTLTVAPTEQTGRIYSDIPTGEIPEGMRERGFSQNIRTDAAMPDDIRQSFDENPEVYKQISNQKTLQEAQEIFNKGQAAAEADFYQSISSNSFRPADVPLAKMLARQAAEQGDIGKARQILSSVAEKLTEAGQFSQAAKILREADPETFLMTMDKQLKKLNEQGRKKYGKKWKDIDLMPDEIDMINKLPRGDQQAYEQAWEQIGERISRDMHASGMEKFNAWRRMAMLLNPKTHIRNIGGNAIMMGMRKMADTIGAGLQRAFLPEGQRTQSVGWSFNSDIVNKVNENWEAVKGDLLGESRWTIGDINAINREKRIYKKGLLTRAAEAVMGHEFDRGFLQWLNDVSLKTLNLEDNIFTERAYKDALGQYLHANNLDVVTDEAVEYATRRALEATFKQANMLASFINKAKNVPVAGFFVEGAIPFTKTPANIIMRGIEYSPGGLFKALYDVKSGKTAATVIEDLSKGLTGSVIAVLAFWLASMGWAKVERKRSEKAEALYQELGEQTYAINTPLGSYTFDWAQPFSIPFAMGVAASEALRGRKDGDTIIQAVIDGIAAGGDTIFNMTMLQNVRNILGSYGSPTEKIMGIPLDYLEQAIFSVFGQAARAIDPVRRSTYDPSPTNQWWNTIKARIPGLSQTLEPALDIWGQEQYQGGPLQQFISPGYYRERSNDPVTQELARLYESVNDASILPKTAPNSFTKDKVEYKLSAQQKTEFARIMGQENYIDLNALIHSEAYQSATDEQKAKMVNKIVEDNYDYAKDVIIGGAR